MKGIQHAILGILLMGGSIPQAVLSNIVVIENSIGEKLELEIDENERFQDVLNQIQTYFQEDMVMLQDHGQEQRDGVSDLAGFSWRDPQWNLIVSHAGLTAKAKHWREYNTPVTKKEKEDILFIMRILASDSLLSVAKKKSSLNSAGERIDHLHPFRFLMTIFTDEELKARIAAIRDRGGWVGDGFFDGITGSLQEESSRGNLLQHTSDFAGLLNIDVNLISSTLKQGKWKEFVNILIDKIPREMDPKRYNM